jgi:hypothetical protein
MVRQATARNRAVVKEGRVDLRLGSQASLSTLGVLFDKVLIVNKFGIWSAPEQNLKNLRNVMPPDGEWRSSRSPAARVSLPRRPGEPAE